MPQRLPSPCAHPGCPAVTTARRCPDHTRGYEQRRGSAASRGYGARHRSWRKLVLARDPLCVECLKERRTVASIAADHVVPLAQGGTWSLDNGQGLCTSCHGRKSAREGNALR